MVISEIMRLIDLTFHCVDIDIHSKSGNEEVLANTDIVDKRDLDNFIDIIGDLEVTMIMPFDELYITICCESWRKPDEILKLIKIYDGMGGFKEVK